jgi:GNAT superfamily N-acetyltransferase
MSTPDRLITTHLAMTSRGQLRPVPTPDDDIHVRPWGQVDVAFYLFLYQSVGYDLRWRDRLIMPTDQLEAALHLADVNILTVGGVPAGYIELERHADDSIEVAYFGLRPAYHGRGLGKYLLSYGLLRAWDMNPTRVHVHTCNLDGAHALYTYQSRGFEIVRVEDEPMPERYKT